MTPAPAPTATPATVSDPCGSIMSVVNRPSFGTGVCTVRTGHADVEIGYANAVTTGSGGGATATYPQVLVRFGTADPRFDVELGAPGAGRTSVGGSLATGASDASIGAKYELGYDALASWGVSGVVTLPTGTGGFTAGRPQYSGSFNWARTLDSEFALSGSLGAGLFAGPDAFGATRSYLAFSPTLALTAALPGGPSQVTAEYAYFSAAGPDLGGKSWFDVIYQRDAGPHVQFDIEYGVSPTSINGQTQHYVGAGLAFMN